MTRLALTEVLQSVIDERQRQDQRWGVQRLSWVEWLSVLTEEVGEAAQEANTLHWHGGELDKLRAELVQVAAVAVAAIEHVDSVVPIGSNDQPKGGV